jgi:DNA topoisomerase VI subunit B
VTEASAYVVEEIQGKLESAHKKLVNYLRKSSRSISAKKEIVNYEKELDEVLKIFDKSVEEYPEDEEMKKIADRYSSFYSRRHSEDGQGQKETLSHLISDLKSLVHWRKMETAYGRTLGFSNFRSLRGESKKR